MNYIAELSKVFPKVDNQGTWIAVILSDFFPESKLKLLVNGSIKTQSAAIGIATDGLLSIARSFKFPCFYIEQIILHRRRIRKIQKILNVRPSRRLISQLLFLKKELRKQTDMLLTAVQREIMQEMKIQRKFENSW